MRDEIIFTLLLYLPMCWDYRYIPPHQAYMTFSSWLHLLSLQMYKADEQSLSLQSASASRILSMSSLLSSWLTSQELSAVYSSDLPLHRLPRERSQFTPCWQSGLISLVSKCQFLGILSHSAECLPDTFCFLLVLWMRNVLQRFMYLNTSSWVGATLWGVMETLGGTVLLEEAHHWEWALSVYSLTPFPVLPLTFPFCLLCVGKDVISQFLALACVPRPPCVSWSWSFMDSG